MVPFSAGLLVCRSRWSAAAAVAASLSLLTSFLSSSSSSSHLYWLMTPLTPSPHLTHHAHHAAGLARAGGRAKVPPKSHGPTSFLSWFFLSSFHTWSRGCEQTLLLLSAHTDFLVHSGSSNLFKTKSGFFLKNCFQLQHVINPHFLYLAPPPPLAGVHGRAAQTPGAQPADADGAKGLRGARSQPAGGQPVEGFLLVLRQRPGHAVCGSHSGGRGLHSWQSAIDAATSSVWNWLNLCFLYSIKQNIGLTKTLLKC